MPHFEAVAVNGAGVFDTLKLVIKLVLDKARKGAEVGAGAQAPSPSAATARYGYTGATAPAAANTPAQLAPVQVAAVPSSIAPRPVESLAASSKPVVTLPSGPSTVDEPIRPVAAALIANEPSEVGVSTTVRGRVGVAPERGDAFSEKSGSEAEAMPTVIRPTVIPPAPSRKRTGDAPKAKANTKTKKRSFWKRLFNWI
jgi:hypothetical protein